jgi:uncharacterized protein
MIPPGTNTELLILQPTPFCNIDCDYCYLPNRADTTKMHPDVARAAAERIVEAGLVGPRVSIVWHAGEPLTMGLASFEALVDAVNGAIPASTEVTHHVQTNAMLISSDWCDLFERKSIRIGVSVDGPAFLHDAHRRTRSGKGTHERTLAGIRLLIERRIAFHAIAVVTDATLDHPDEFYDFFSPLPVHLLGLNVEEIEGTHHRSSLQGLATKPRYRRFMARLFQRVQEDGFKLGVREFNTAMAAVRFSGDAMPPASDQQNVPWRIVTVDCGGQYTTFSPELLGLAWGEDTFVIGSVQETPIRAAAASAKFQRLEGEIAAGIRACEAGCEYFQYCGGGAPVNKYSENGSFASTETMFCQLTRKVVLDVVAEELAQAGRSPRVRVTAP